MSANSSSIAHEVFIGCKSSEEKCHADCNTQYPANTGIHGFLVGDSCYDPKEPYVCSCLVSKQEADKAFEKKHHH